MSDFRREDDLLGPRDVPADALYGIHAHRAMENFPLLGRPVRRAMVHAYGQVKLACAHTNYELGRWRDRPEVFAAIRQACQELAAGELDAHVRVDACQGGAGTSTNMAVNEVLANRALQILGRALGDYAAVDPHDDLNRHQSTNDTFPTALKVAAMGELAALQRAVVALMEAFQDKEKQFAEVVKIGRTEMQDAVLTTLGREMSAYAEALSRDRWRLYKCQERLRVVNLGGTAIGTALGAPRPFVFGAVEQLRGITGLNLARAENLVEATQNADVFVEVSGILKALATSLIKIAQDLRLMSSGPHGGLGEIRLPPRQAGSSIMPGKVNPVIPESVIQAGMLICGHDAVIAHAAASGNLELNAFLPLIAECLLESIELLGRTCDRFARFCVRGIEADEDRCRRHVDGSTATATALVDSIGYDRATAAAAEADASGRSIREIVVANGWMSEEDFAACISAERVMQLGSRPRREQP